MQLTNSQPYDYRMKYFYDFKIFFKKCIGYSVELDGKNILYYDRSLRYFLDYDRRV